MEDCLNRLDHMVKQRDRIRRKLDVETATIERMDRCLDMSIASLHPEVKENLQRFWKHIKQSHTELEEAVRDKE